MNHLTSNIWEALYWAICILALLLIPILRARLKRDSAAKKFKRGRIEGRKFRADGLTTASIESFLRMKRDGGLYGPFEAGIASAINEEKK